MARPGARSGSALRVSGFRGLHDDVAAQEPAPRQLLDRSLTAHTCETIYKLIGDGQFPDMLLELDAATNYSETLLGHRALSTSELVALRRAARAWHRCRCQGRRGDDPRPATEPGVRGDASSRRKRKATPGQRARRGIPEPNPDRSALWRRRQGASRHGVPRRLLAPLERPRRSTPAYLCGGIYTMCATDGDLLRPTHRAQRSSGRCRDRGVGKNNSAANRIRLSLLAVDTQRSAGAGGAQRPRARLA